ncbi:MAG: hypothetical protein QGG80_02975 [Candidatus Krumholzibacteria bacterium]|jgi:hypothetical protein|nr:hypothetical protein [Candidatus Krumholzibacteria bacterium]MDP6797527.1 hypothetical protein [Candidatus Krumholzibacteria bacterium]MDP7021374.1 hypothetical protein [Candidatus Krumholzibacteria bacterium]
MSKTEAPKLSEEDRELLENLAKKVVRRRLSVPAIFFLESTKPLNYVGSQAMVFFGPFVRMLFESPNYYRYTELFEDREVVELLLRMIEEQESDQQSKEREERRNRPRRGIFARFRKGKDPESRETR